MCVFTVVIGLVPLTLIWILCSGFRFCRGTVLVSGWTWSLAESLEGGGNCRILAVVVCCLRRMLREVIRSLLVTWFSGARFDCGGRTLFRR